MKRLIIAVALVLLMVGVSSATSLTIGNCTSGTLVDGVKWTDDDMSDYTDVNLLTHEIKTFLDIEPGLYALTHYRPREVLKRGNQTLVFPAVILDYVDNVRVIEDENTYISFGCE